MCHLAAWLRRFVSANVWRAHMRAGLRTVPSLPDSWRREAHVSRRVRKRMYAKVQCSSSADIVNRRVQPRWAAGVMSQQSSPNVLVTMQKQELRISTPSHSPAPSTRFRPHGHSDASRCTRFPRAGPAYTVCTDVLQASGDSFPILPATRWCTSIHDHLPDLYLLFTLTTSHPYLQQLQVCHTGLLSPLAPELAFPEHRTRESIETI